MAEMIEEPEEVFEIEDPASPSSERKIMKKIELAIPSASHREKIAISSVVSPSFLVGEVPFSVRIRRISGSFCSQLYLFNQSGEGQKISVTPKKGPSLALACVIRPYQEKYLGLLNNREKGKRKLKMTVTLHTEKTEGWTR